MWWAIAGEEDWTDEDDDDQEWSMSVWSFCWMRNPPIPPHASTNPSPNCPKVATFELARAGRPLFSTFSCPAASTDHPWSTKLPICDEFLRWNLSWLPQTHIMMLPVTFGLEGAILLARDNSLPATLKQGHQCNSHYFLQRFQNVHIYCSFIKMVTALLDQN